MFEVTLDGILFGFTLGFLAGAGLFTWFAVRDLKRFGNRIVEKVKNANN